MISNFYANGQWVNKKIYIYPRKILRFYHRRRSIPVVPSPPLSSSSPPLKSLPPILLRSPRRDPPKAKLLFGFLCYAFWAPTNVVRYVVAEWFCGFSLCWLFCGRSLRRRLRLNGIRWLFCGRPLCRWLCLNGFRHCLCPLLST